MSRKPANCPVCHHPWSAHLTEGGAPRPCVIRTGEGPDRRPEPCRCAERPPARGPAYLNGGENG